MAIFLQEKADLMPAVHSRRDDQRQAGSDCVLHGALVSSRFGRSRLGSLHLSRETLGERLSVSVYSVTNNAEILTATPFRQEIATNSSSFTRSIDPL